MNSSTWIYRQCSRSHEFIRIMVITCNKPMNRNANIVIDSDLDSGSIW
jgi:hypothetical protein